MLSQDSVPMDPSYTGPTPTYDPSTKRYKPTKEFVEGMIQMFKDGGKLPKRLCFEVVLGCKEALDREESLVEVEVGKGVKCDIVGDTHGVSPVPASLIPSLIPSSSAILRLVQFAVHADPAIRNPRHPFQRYVRRPPSHEEKR